MAEPIAPYHERLPDLERELVERGSLGVLVLDASPLSTIEDEYGTAPYEEIRQRVFKILDESRGKDYRQGDILSLDRPRGLRFVFVLDRDGRYVDYHARDRKLLFVPPETFLGKTINSRRSKCVTPSYGKKNNDFNQ